MAVAGHSSQKAGLGWQSTDDGPMAVRPCTSVIGLAALSILADEWCDTLRYRNCKGITPRPVVAHDAAWLFVLYCYTQNGVARLAHV